MLTIDEILLINYHKLSQMYRKMGIEITMIFEKLNRVKIKIGANILKVFKTYVFAID